MKNVKLTEVRPFISARRVCLGLTYQYEDEKGVHTFIIPKILSPFLEYELPVIEYLCADGESPYIETGDRLFLEKSVCDLAIERGYKDPGHAFDIVTDPAMRELTLAEIEKELGYKVKIVNKKENGNDPDNL